MGKIICRITILIVVIVVVAVTAVSCWLSPRDLPGYVIGLGQNKVLTPQGYADTYSTDHFGTHCWQFDLDSDEVDSINNYIEQYSDSWHEMTDYSYESVSSAFSQLDSIDFNSIPIEGSYYCIIDSTYTFRSAGEFFGGKYAVYIWDSTNSKYYCFYTTGR